MLIVNTWATELFEKVSETFSNLQIWQENRKIGNIEIENFIEHKSQSHMGFDQMGHRWLNNM